MTNHTPVPGCERDPFHFEVGPIRPPSEARSLLLRVTRNCPWNHCTFCPVYKRTRFSRRPVQDVLADIDAMGRLRDWVSEVSRRLGEAGALTIAVARGALAERPDHPGLQQLLLFLLAGGSTAFLQDANSLVMRPDELARVLRRLRQTFPALERVTSYARSHTLARRTVEELRGLREAGLDRIHVGLESGSDRVLTRVRKGNTRAVHIEAGQRVIAAGMELSEYVMPGLGGVDLSDEHAEQTADALNQIGPHFIRLRSLGLRSGTELRATFEAAGFVPLNDDGVAREIRRLVAGLRGLRTTLVSDHVLNLLEGVEGRLPEDRERLLGVLDAYLDLPEDDRLAFQLGRRLGALRDPADLDAPGARARLQPYVEAARAHPDGPDGMVRELLQRFI
jgi:hypothetical protein